ncbi:MAG TPA: hypothetical protein DDW52_24190, partial [Planctomycetaceae bacterium]|nr:hypothetical protein [Planctomycetaceae bacterium]
GSLLSAQGSAAENGPNLTGRWVGTWDQPAAGKQRRDHRGSLRVRLRPVGPGQYRGVFAGRFAVVIPYIYRADVYQYGHTITSTRRLGPLGNYSMNLRANGNSLRGGWSAMGYRGNIQLQRR